ncbi:MAG: protease inhibitor I42 family protein [Candidatus Paceibacterota bacterium]|jgi:predicted secreted protein|nr:protease inhibitor I42 family protein [Candidatus Pacearchaeota archaeon]
MRKILIPTIIVLAIVIGFVVWYFLPKNSTEEKIQMFPTEAINGQNFLITLLGNQSSGYEWNANYDAEAVEFVTREYVEMDKTLANGAGLEKFTFKALKEGVTQIEFVFKKPVEEDDKAIDRIYYQITVKSNI